MDKKLQIKDASLIVNQSSLINKSGVKDTVITIKNFLETQDHVKLGHVFEFLPSGLIVKGETGLGATTLELRSNRNSIVIEPIKITASSKAKKENALYVGSPTIIHPYKVEEKDILNFIENTKTPKKIIAVADSLYKIIRALGENIYEDFFFMIDEIDSFQLDSSFRKSMEKCLDIYKLFPRKMRAMVSATTLKFSDPQLAKEEIVNINYQFPSKRKITLCYTPKKMKNVAANVIAEILSTNPEDKIMIAFNSVTGCFDLAKHIEKNNLPNYSIKILCSNNSKDKVGDYFAELQSEILPAKINFVTSAYFTGFDLSERFHLISISSNIHKIHSLSDKRLKQIAGRCRDPQGLFSETIIYNTVPKEDTYIVYNLKEMIEAAKTEVSAINFIEHNFQFHSLLKESTKTLRNLIAQHSANHGFRLIRLKDETPLISYLNIDAYFEAQRIKYELYRYKSTLPKILKKAGHIITNKISNLDVEVESIKIEGTKKEQVKEIILRLRELKKETSPLELIKNSELSIIQKDIIRKYNVLYEYIETDKLLHLFELAGEKTDSRQLNNIFLGAYYLTLNPETHYKRAVMHHMPIGQAFTALELNDKWNIVFLETILSKTINKPTTAVRLTKIHFKVRKKRGESPTHLLKAINPYNFQLIKFREYQQNDFESIIKLFSL